MEAEVMSLRTVLKLSASSRTRSAIAAPPRQNPGRPPRKPEVPVQRPGQNTNKGKGKEVEVSRSDEEIDELIDDDDAPTGETPRVVKLQSSKSRGKARAAYEKGTPLMTDARAEHVLLAAKKLGRERAGQLSGMTPRDVRRPSGEREEQPASLTPRTPRRPSYNTPVASQPHHPQERYSYMDSPAVGYLFPVGASSWPQPQTPMVQRDPSGSNNPQTPFDDLVSVASRMLDEETPGKNSPNKRSRRLADESDSPLPRKRRASNDREIGRTSTLSSQRSALDVLADQATKEFDSETSRSAFDSGDERGAIETGSPRRKNGRGIVVRELTARSTAETMDHPAALHPSGTVETPSRPGMPSPAAPRRASGDYRPLAPAPTINSRTRSQSSAIDERYPGLSPRVASYPRPLLAAPPYPRLGAPPHHPPHDLPQGMYGDPRYALPFGQGYPLGMGYGIPPHQYPSPDYNSSRGAKVSIDGASPSKKKRADDKRAKTPYKKVRSIGWCFQ